MPHRQSEYTYAVVNQNEQNGATEQVSYEKDETASLPLFGVRHWQILILFALNFVAFSFRSCLSVAIVPMTNPSVNVNPDVPTYPNWTHKNVIHSAFLWGYILPQVLAAHMAKKYGPKWFLVGAMAIQSFLGVTTPFVASHFGEVGIMISRALQGFCQGFIFPSLSHLLSRWIPIQARTRWSSVVFSAGKAGAVFSIIATGLFAASWNGWPMAFYFYGLLGAVWCIFMILFGYNAPSNYPKISQAEKNFIEQNTGLTQEHVKTPWRKIFKSVPVWALLIVQAGNTYCFWTLLTQIPTYMNYIMHFNMKQNGILSSLPYLAFWLLGFVFGPTSDFLINRNIISRGVARKIFNSIGLVVPATALIILGYTKEGHQIQGVILLIVAVGINAACYSALMVNHIDLSPNHAGILMGVCNGLSHIAALLAPLVVQFLVVDVRNPDQWRQVFLIAATINVSTALIYDIFGSGEVQPWNTDEDIELKHKK
ncbi:putative inorganic phosphate cotransporter [Anthonomus grandis grandis]|uniref:putative inorganic phosphate cotransporter n=1 Tax=Anthonomus grandis grandis TaxID=2921223 RepID=UPI002165E8BC|nr:putative inorganic phosphate cotransporter [Anthonomus grandis grandis]